MVHISSSSPPFSPEATNVFPLRLISLSWDKKEGRPAAAAAMPAGEGGRQDARGAYTRYVRISYARQDCVRRSHHLPPYSLSWDSDPIIRLRKVSSHPALRQEAFGRPKKSGRPTAFKERKHLAAVTIIVFSRTSIVPDHPTFQNVHPYHHQGML